MQIPAISSSLSAPKGVQDVENAKTSPGNGKLHEASQQFEAIMLRQILGESMKPLLQGGPSGQVYGYLMTDTLADSLSKGGGLGLSSVIQAQLSGGAK
jgi:flagellar protein FlgJ